MEAVKAILIPVVAVLVLDWVMVGRFAANFDEFDYRYWPPTWQRALTVMLCILMAEISGLIFVPGEAPVWPLLAWAFVIALWLIVAVDDVARQRAIGYRKPPRYSEPDGS